MVELARTCTPHTHTHADAAKAKEFLGRMPHLEEKAVAECVFRNMILQQVGAEVNTKRDLDLVEEGEDGKLTGNVSK